MREDEKLLDEVVVVGYGVQKKASVVGAISSVGTKDLVKMSTPTLSTALTGQLPGVTTIQTSAIPGVDETEIYIRGKGTWADASPLIIVDGIERATFTNIDPHEVESVSVLKDASATAVYGVKGANGVVLITTIRGSESKPRVNILVGYTIYPNSSIIEMTIHPRNRTALAYVELSNEVQAKQIFEKMADSVNVDGEYFNQFGGSVSEDVRTATNYYIAALGNKGLHNAAKAGELFRKALEYSPNHLWCRYFLEN